MSETLQGIKFFEDLMQKDTDALSFVASATSTKNQTKLPQLLQIIGLQKEQLSNIALSALEALEEYGKTNDNWTQFKWRFWAFLELQDIFDAPFLNSKDPLIIFQTWYFYYESKYILIESLLAGLNGLYQASQIVLRIFLEFSVLQNYYYLHSFKNNSYFDVEKCLKSGIKPIWNTLIRGALEKVDFTIPIRERIKAHYKALSNNSSHPYHQDFSPKITNRSSTPTHTIVGIMGFWQTIDLILESVIWMYYANFPMALQPKEIVKKFGYNGPVGIFLDLSQTYIIKNALSKADFDSFQNYSDHHENVKSLNQWFEQHEDLTADEIKATWNEKEDGKVPEDIAVARILKSAKLRALREAMSLSSINPKFDSIDISKLDFSLAGLASIFSSRKRKKR